jgi:uncharacterized protein YbbC (DUF1343 family)
VLTGLDQLLEDPGHFLKGRRIGLVSHASGTTATLDAGVDALVRHRDVHLSVLFGAEHGLRGEVPAGDPVPDGDDGPTGLPLISLYGPRRAPTRDMLEGLDLLVLDFQDIGSRYYTFISTTMAVIEVALAAECPVLLLDRPNPLGGLLMAGNVLTESQLSFVGALPMPMQHGLTLGELVRWRFGTTHPLITVLPVAGLTRQMTWEDWQRPWVPPSPNSSGIAMARLYPGTCLLEGTNLSEGRGTPYPFEMMGAPFIDPFLWARTLNAWELPGVRFRPVAFRPTASKHQGTVVQGVQVHQVSPRAVEGTLVGFALLSSAARLWPDDFQFIDFFRLLGGDPGLATMISEGVAPRDIDAHYQLDREGFFDRVKPALLY